jgi:hypothetical protein
VADDKAPAPSKLTDEQKTVVAAQKAQAEARLATAKVQLKAAEADLESAGHPPVPLGAPLEDALGRDLDWSDPDAARAQQRAAKEQQISRTEIDQKRVARGLDPLFATE